jgi:L-iditol 2-dehydrogenase
MKAVVLTGPNQFSTQEIEKPQIGADEMLLKMEKPAICGTDIRILEGTKTKGVRYPSVIGHEMSGTLVEIGEKVTWYEIGNRISLGNVIPCGRCNNCLNDRENACLNPPGDGLRI